MFKKLTRAIEAMKVGSDAWLEQKFPQAGERANVKRILSVMSPKTRYTDEMIAQELNYDGSDITWLYRLLKKMSDKGLVVAEEGPATVVTFGGPVAHFSLA